MKLLAFFLLITSTVSVAQCDWAKKISVAIQRRYQTNENACKALTFPPEEFNRAHALLEQQSLSELRFISSPNLDSWFGQHSERMLRQLYSSPSQQTVRISSDTDLNAFATGQNVTFKAGLIEWYLQPEKALLRQGYPQNQVSAFLSKYGYLNPGANGLLAVLAHETSHNILGHPDVQPLVLACNDYIDSGIREIHGYEQLVSTGKKGSRFGAFFRATAFLASETMIGDQRTQQKETDADELGVWLAYRDTGDPQAMSKSLRWLSMFPGAAGRGGVSEVLCSSHPQVLSRVATTSSLAYSAGGCPPRHLLQLPQNATRKRYEEFTSWYSRRIDWIDRASAGNLTPEELRTTRTVQIEVKPKDSTAWLDGKPITPNRTSVSLTFGPHILHGTYNGLDREYTFVVLDEGPDKFKLEIK